MPISIGDKLPDATLLRMGANGPEEVTLSSLSGGKLVLFGLPGAYTGVCSTAHLPSFSRTLGGFKDKGVDHVVCVSVNDPFVMGAWGDSTGATEAGVEMLADAGGELARALDLAFTAPPIGLYDRFQRFALYAEGGEVKVLHVEENPGVCEVSGGEAMLDAI